MKLFLYFIAIFLGTQSFAVTKYVAQSASGANDGSSAGNAYSMAQLNAASPYSPAGDDIVILNGTITTALLIPTSGTSGHVITYQFASGAKFSSTVWGETNGAININAKSFIVIDGGTNGIIENTANGTVLANHLGTYGIVHVGGSTDVEIKNLTIQTMYVRTSTTDVNVSSDDCEGIHVQNPGNNLSIHNNTISNVAYCIDIQSSFNVSGISIYSNDWSICNIGLNWGISGNTVTGPQVYLNNAHDYAAWDDTTGANNYHHNAMHIYINSGAVTGLGFYRNKFSGTAGQFTTSNLCYIEGGTFTSTLIYDNLSLQPSDNGPNFGCIAFGPGPVASSCIVSNNTLIGNSLTYGVLVSGGAGNQLLIKNNIFMNHASAGFFYNAAANVVWDYNFYTGNTQAGTDGSGTTYSTLALWKAFLGGSNEANGVTSTTSNVNTNGTLATGSAAIGAGLDLSATYTVDYAGTTRTLPWDIGAYKYTGAGGTGGSTLSGKITLTGKVSIK